VYRGDLFAITHARHARPGCTSIRSAWYSTSASTTRRSSCGVRSYIAGVGCGFPDKVSTSTFTVGESLSCPQASRPARRSRRRRRSSHHTRSRATARLRAYEFSPGSAPRPTRRSHRWPHKPLSQIDSSHSERQSRPPTRRRDRAASGHGSGSSRLGIGHRRRSGLEGRSSNGSKRGTRDGWGLHPFSADRQSAMRNCHGRPESGLEQLQSVRGH